MLIIGVISGVLAAVGQAGSYQLGRRAAVAEVSPVRLMVSIQLFFTALGLSWLVVRGLPTNWLHGEAIWLVIIAVAGFVSAQLGTFVALRYIPGSRLAPLMGLKVALLAFVSWMIGLETMTGGRWLAVGLILAAFAAVWKSGALPMRGFLAVLWTISSFALADICSKKLLVLMPDSHLLAMGDLLSVQYVTGGLMVLPFLLWPANRPRWSERGVMVPYALCWLAAVWFLMYSFAHAGLLLGVFCQALRGPLSVGLGWFSATRGLTAMEAQHSKSMWIRQLIAAILMVAAIVVDLLAR